MKKTGKMILKGLGWVMVGALLFVAGVAIYDLIKEKDDNIRNLKSLIALLEKGQEEYKND